MPGLPPPRLTHPSYHPADAVSAEDSSSRSLVRASPGLPVSVRAPTPDTPMPLQRGISQHAAQNGNRGVYSKDNEKTEDPLDGTGREGDRAKRWF